MSTEPKANEPKAQTHDEELSSEELEAVQGGALNAYLKMKGQKQGTLAAADGSSKDPA